MPDQDVVPTACPLLLVEDEPEMVAMLEIALRIEGFHVVASVPSAEEAIEAARRHAPRLVVLDHRLAGKMTGLEAAPLIKAAAPECRIVLFTANILDDDTAHMGVDAVVNKLALLLLPETLKKFCDPDG